MDEDLTEKQFDFLMEYMNHLQYTVRLKRMSTFLPVHLRLLGLQLWTR